ncbi:hypothetical protein FRB95_014238 [Tulasnella sp. JGI-2019a]|nr:hypothetical protein FRB95_014238 [Tulasnella sp. JGI-2019a]
MSVTLARDGVKTPPPLPSVSIETPAVARHTSTQSYLSGNLEQSRTAVLKDLKPIPIAENDVFKQWLPRLQPGVNVEQIRDRLIESKSLTLNGWKHWPNDPAHTAGSENEVFKAFSTPVGDIISAIKLEMNIAPTATLLNNPTGTPLSERRNTSQPDGYMVLEPVPRENLRPYAVLKHQEKPGTGNLLPTYWEDIAVPLEYKKDNTPTARLDDERKMVWSLHHILRNNPCRRSAFGITLENNNLRVWFCHRAGTITSKGFDFMTDHDELIHLVSSLAFATKVDLGWDPTIVPIVQLGQIAYKITVHIDAGGEPEVFTSTKIISDYGAEATQGRGTRIYLARSDTDNNEVVIKDSWQDHNRTREGKIMEALMDDLKKIQGVDMDDVEKHFLKARCYGDVLIGSVVDSTLKIMHDIDVPADSLTLRIPPSDELTDLEPKKGSASVGQVPLVRRTFGGRANTTGAPPQRVPYVMSHRVHHRIVFTERGRSLHEIHDPKQMLDVLVHIVRGLEYMWRCGWIHRDISAGNILIIKNRGVLSDLEYAKKYTPTDTYGPHDMRTGTFEFMAIEVARGAYVFNKPLRFAKYKQPFKHNPLHDLESVWWVAVWSIVSLSPEAGSYSLQNHLDGYTAMFPKTSNLASSRSDFITVKYHFERFIYEKFLEVFAETLGKLDDMRQQMLEWYETAYQPFERQEPADMAVFNHAYDQVMEFIESAQAKLPDDTKFITLREALRRLSKHVAQTTTQD